MSVPTDGLDPHTHPPPAAVVGVERKQLHLLVDAGPQLDPGPRRPPEVPAVRGIDRLAQPAGSLDQVGQVRPRRDSEPEVVEVRGFHGRPGYVEAKRTARID